MPTIFDKWQSLTSSLFVHFLSRMSRPPPIENYLGGSCRYIVRLPHHSQVASHSNGILTETQEAQTHTASQMDAGAAMDEKKLEEPPTGFGYSVNPTLTRFCLGRNM